MRHHQGKGKCPSSLLLPCLYLCLTPLLWLLRPGLIIPPQTIGGVAVKGDVKGHAFEGGMAPRSPTQPPHQTLCPLLYLGCQGLVLLPLRYRLPVHLGLIRYQGVHCRLHLGPPYIQVELLVRCPFGHSDRVLAVIELLCGSPFGMRPRPYLL